MARGKTAIERDHSGLVDRFPSLPAFLVICQRLLLPAWPLLWLTPET